MAIGCACVSILMSIYAPMQTSTSVFITCFEEESIYKLAR
jgi:hypothetical protein